ncbi:MAG: c-type cytochrome [Rhodothermales bacterium]
MTYLRLNFPAVVFVSAFLIVSGCSPDDNGTSESSDDTAQRGQPVAVDHIERGRLAYQSFCASCHGVDGRGDGPVADVLTTPLGDLTQLKRQNDGTYPAQEVYTVIDGRNGVQAHGTREMPVWGHVWMEEDGTPVRQEFVDARINELVEYLRTIQEPVEDSESASADSL